MFESNLQQQHGLRLHIFPLNYCNSLNLQFLVTKHFAKSTYATQLSRNYICKQQHCCDTYQYKTNKENCMLLVVFSISKQKHTSNKVKDDFSKYRLCPNLNFPAKSRHQITWKWHFSKIQNLKQMILGICLISFLAIFASWYVDSSEYYISFWWEISNVVETVPKNWLSEKIHL